MLQDLITELHEAINCTEAIKELKQLDLPCYMEPEGGEVCDEDCDDPCDACAVHRILDLL